MIDPNTFLKNLTSLMKVVDSLDDMIEKLGIKGNDFIIYNEDHGRSLHNIIEEHAGEIAEDMSDEAKKEEFLSRLNDILYS